MPREAAQSWAGTVADPPERVRRMTECRQGQVPEVADWCCGLGGARKGATAPPRLRLRSHRRSKHAFRMRQGSRERVVELLLKLCACGCHLSRPDPFFTQSCVIRPSAGGPHWIACSTCVTAAEGLPFPRGRICLFGGSCAPCEDFKGGRGRPFSFRACGLAFGV
jgi:hypothetical protein